MAKDRKINSTYSNNQKLQVNNCPIVSTLNLINGRWKIGILWHVNLGYKRFGALKKVLGNVTEKMLTQQLRELEEDGFLIRTVFAEVPLRVEYKLTDLGSSLIPVLEAINAWGDGNNAVERYALKLDKLLKVN